MYSAAPTDWEIDTFLTHLISICGSPRGVVANALDCGLEISEFELKSHNYVNFWTNTRGKVMNSLIRPVIGHRFTSLAFH